MAQLPPDIQLALAAVAVTAAIFDILYSRIPNWLVLPSWLLGLGLNAGAGGWNGLAHSAQGLALALAIYLLLAALRAMRFGDVKLMAAVGALVGPVNWWTIFLVASVFGGLIALVMVVFAGRARRTLFNTGYIVWELMHFRAPYHRSPELDVTSDRSFRMPHGLAVGLGCLAFLGTQALLAG
jgi:prepilin peptidase CpaA